MATKQPVLVPEGAFAEKHGDGPSGKSGKAGRAGVSVDRNGLVLSWSAEATLLTGCSAADAVGRPFADLCGDGKFAERLDAAGDETVEVVVTLDSGNGDPDFVRTVVTPRLDAGGSLTGYQLEFRTALEPGKSGVAFADAAALETDFMANFGAQDSPAFLIDGDDLRILELNPAASRAVGRPSGAMIGLTLAEAFDMERNGMREERPADAGAVLSVLRLENGDGDIRSYGMSLVQVRWETRNLALCILHELTGWVSMRAELTRTNQELSRLARHDHLTGLFNRPMFKDTLELANSRVDRAGGLLGVLYIDLDGFKPVNDRFGHDAGDKVLLEVARRLKSGVRSSDVVARLGGDEFGAILENLRQRKDALKVARHLIESIGEPFEVKGETVRISASIGAVVTPRTVEDASELVAQADRTMYEAKSLGCGRAALAPADRTAKRRRTVRQS